MNNAKLGILNSAAQFIRVVLDEQVINPEATSQTINSFREKLNALNESVDHEDTRPFMIIDRATGNLPDESLVNRLILAADTQGLADQFKKITENGVVLGFFGHKARAYVEQVAEDMSIAYCNILSNGLVFDDIHLVGLYTASTERLQASLQEIEQRIRLHV